MRLYQKFIFLLGAVFLGSALIFGEPPGTPITTREDIAYAAEAEPLNFDWAADHLVRSQSVAPLSVAREFSKSLPRSQALGCNPTGGSGGLPVGTHDVVLAGRPATIIVGQGYDPATPTYLAYYLHGDEGGYNFHTSPFNVVNQFINANRWIYVAPQAPPDPTNAAVFPWDGRNGGSISGNAAQVRDVLDDMFAKYNVCRDILFGAGVSGGSWFYDAYFFPHNGVQYPAFFNLNCGASGINDTWFWYQSLVVVSNNAEAKARSEMKYTIGTNDFLYNNALVSVPTYTSLGFSVSTEYLQDVGHCAYNTGEKIRDYWQAKFTLLTNPIFVYLPFVKK